MEINWKNIHYYILIAIFLNFFMLYYLKDNSENILENENIIEITPEQAQFLLEKHPKKEKEKRNENEGKEKRKKGKEKDKKGKENKEKNSKKDSEKVKNTKKNLEKIHKELNESKKKKNITISNVAEGIGRTLGEGEKPIPFHQIQSFLEEIYINKEIHTNQITISAEDFTKDNFSVAIFSVIILVIIAIVATIFEFKSKKKKKEKNEGEVGNSEVSYLLMQ